MGPIRSDCANTFEGQAAAYGGQCTEGSTAASEDVGALQTIENKDSEYASWEADVEVVELREEMVAVLKEELALKRAQLAALRRELEAQRSSEPFLFSFFCLF